jgi:DNA (cytosine-5)-methyltransferase 1
MSDALSAISLFTGVGGLDYGFEAAGFDTRVALEIDATCCKSLRASRHWPVIEADLMETTTAALLKAGGLKPGQADILIGGPPCQPFSKSGWWAKGDSLRLGDSRANTLTGYLRVVREARPKAFLLENVEGLKFEGKDEGIKLLLSALEEINRSARTNYLPTVITLNAADFGVPQTRTRVFVIASRDGRPFIPPTPTHQDPSHPQLLPGERWMTAWDALGGMSSPDEDDLDLTGKWADLLPTIPEGQNYLWHTDRMDGMPLFGWRRRYWNFLLKLAKNRPAWTIQAQPGPATGPFHWHNRRLSGAEMMALQTFPTNITITGGRGDVQRQVGNAVPSLLAEVLGREIRSQFFGHAVLRATPTLLPERRDDLPAPERVKKVPKKFLSLIGDHTAHPGTGRGNLYGSKSSGLSGPDEIAPELPFSTEDSAVERDCTA